MKIFKSTVLLTGAFSLAAQAQDIFERDDVSPSVVNALDLFFRDIKNFKMVGPRESEYLGGELNVNVHDGFFTVLGCAANNGFFYVLPNITCPSGTTGLITAGDFDGDGVRDVGRYFSVSQPVAARNIGNRSEPTWSNYILHLPLICPDRWVASIGKILVQLFFTTSLTIPSMELDLKYPISLQFGLISLLNSSAKDAKLSQGPTFSSSRRLVQTRKIRLIFFMSVSHREMVEAVPGPGGSSVDSGGIDVGNDFRVTNDDRWNNGVMEFDPRIVFSLNGKVLIHQRFQVMTEFSFRFGIVKQEK